jgi:hypothetical protein
VAQNLEVSNSRFASDAIRSNCIRPITAGNIVGSQEVGPRPTTSMSVLCTDTCACAA